MRSVGTTYQGYLKVSTSAEKVEILYKNPKQNPFQLKENQYLILVNEDGSVADRMKWQDGEIKRFVPKPFDSSLYGKIKAKNVEQECLMDMLADTTTTVKTISGPFGSGKSFLGLAYAIQAINDGKFEKLTYVRNTIEVKNSNSIGYLKGSYMEKMAVWAGPLIDFLSGEDQLENMIDQRKIEIQHLGFMRGRNISNSIIFATEAEHLTREHVQLLLGRVAEGSILILEGDCRQIDAKAFEEDNGLQAVITKLQGNRLFSYIYLQESVRSETAKLADLLNKEE